MIEVIGEMVRTGGPAAVYLAGIIILARYVQNSVAARIQDLSKRCDSLDERANQCERDREALRGEIIKLAAEAGKVELLESELSDLKRNLVLTAAPA